MKDGCEAHSFGSGLQLRIEGACDEHHRYLDHPAENASPLNAIAFAGQLHIENGDLGPGNLGFAEGFADRAYEEDGTLRSREKEGALLLDPALAAAQAVRLVRSGKVATLCVHGDTPGALAILTRVRSAMEEAGIHVAAPRHATR